jgi:hypothetical protein
MANDFKSLLGRKDVSYLDLARGAFGQSKKQRKRNRLGMAGLFLMDLWEANKLAKVNKNLQALDEQKVFDQAGVQKRWDAYSTLIEDEKAFRKDSNYFYTQAEAEFNRLNPDYDMTLQSQRDARKQEVADYQKRLEEIHREKINTGNIDLKMTEEQFMKPFNDYYKSRKEDVMDPRNRSAVHQVLGMFGLGNKRRADLDEKIKTEKAFLEQRKNDLGYLINPDEITGKASIEVYRDPSMFTLTNSEAKLRVIQGIKDPIQQQQVLRSITEENISSTALENKIISQSINFNPEIAKARQAGETFDSLYLQREGRDAIPTSGDDLINYRMQRQDYIDSKTGMGDETSRQIRKIIYSIDQANKTGQPQEVITGLQNQLRSFTTDKVRENFITTIIGSLSDPLVEGKVNKLIEDDTNEISSEADYVESLLNRMYDTYLSVK